MLALAGRLSGGHVHAHMHAHTHVRMQVTVLSSCSLWLVVYPVGLYAPGVLTSFGIGSPYAQVPPCPAMSS